MEIQKMDRFFIPCPLLGVQIILRAFIYCYRKVNKSFFSGKPYSREGTMETVSQGFAKINGRSTNPWIEERIRTKSISLGRRGRKREQN
jgi:hypothetical protein